MTIKKYIVLGVIGIKFKNSEISYTFNKALVLLIISNKCGSRDEKMFKEEKSIGITTILGLIKDMEDYEIDT